MGSRLSSFLCDWQGICLTKAQCDKESTGGALRFIPYVIGAAGLLLPFQVPFPRKLQLLMAGTLGPAGFCAAYAMYWGNERSQKIGIDIFCGGTTAVIMHLGGIEDNVKLAIGAGVGGLIVGPLVQPLFAPHFVVGSTVFDILGFPYAAQRALFCGTVIAGGTIAEDLRSTFWCKPDTPPGCECWQTGTLRIRKETHNGKQVCRAVDCAVKLGDYKRNNTYPLCTGKAAFDALPDNLCECYMHKLLKFDGAAYSHKFSFTGLKDPRVKKQLSPADDNTGWRWGPASVTKAVGDDGKPACRFTPIIVPLSGHTSFLQEPCSTEDNRLHYIYRNPAPVGEKVASVLAGLPGMG